MADDKIPYHMKPLCELIVQWLKEVRGIETTPDAVYNSSPNGELWQVYDWWDQASAYFKAQERGKR